ncbi:MAG: hypothetical protein P8L68_18095 [Paracoccaceae bacterium]|nr:hypothetical protein [Paracoccaceae bacterium]MDG2260391.1 hypothetical protein [Paracoccaceae bacterium]
MKRFLLCLILLPSQLFAGQTEDEYLLSLVRLDEMIEVVRAEGLSDNQNIPMEFFGSSFGGAWTDTLDEIFDETVLSSQIEEEFLSSFGDAPRDEILEFLESDAWQIAVGYELKGRVAMLDPKVEAAAIETYWQTFEKNNRRMQDLTALIEAGDLINTNVVGAMNSMYEFNLGIVSEGFDLGMSEEDILVQIWSEEDNLRYEISEWIYSFLLLAYDPLDTDLLQAQIAFFETPEGKRFNRALIESFDRVYGGISFNLGAAIAILAHEQVL